MQQKINKKNIFIFLFGLYIFIIPFSHMTSIRYISLCLSATLFLYLVVKKEISLEYKNLLFIIFLVYLLESLLSISINKIDIYNSLKAIKSNLLEQIYIIIVIFSFFNTKEKIFLLIKILISSYIVISLLSIFEIIKFYNTMGLDFIKNKSLRGDFRFWNGYSRLSALYFPILIGYYFYLIKNTCKKKNNLYIIVIIISFFLFFLYGSTTPLVFTFTAIIISSIYIFDWKKILTLILIIIIFSSIINTFVLNNAISNKITKTSQYNSLIERFDIWEGIFATLKTPTTILLGHGYGWKKLALIAKKDLNEVKKENYVKTKYYPKFDYFSRGKYGNINPHNGYLEILFTGGIIGLILFLTVILLTLRYIFISKNNVSKIMILPVIISFILNNFTNGYWQGNGGKIIVIFFAIGYILYNLSKREKN